MKFIYPAVFRKTDKGTYKGFFPDLEDCFGEGDTLDEAIEEAKKFDAENGFLIKDYDLSNAKAATLGMVCGGKVKVMFERL